LAGLLASAADWDAGLLAAQSGRTCGADAQPPSSNNHAALTIKRMDMCASFFRDCTDINHVHLPRCFVGRVDAHLRTVAVPSRMQVASPGLAAERRGQLESSDFHT
jgi:hypothetical protein